MAKPDFNKIYFDSSVVVWGRGNDIVGLQKIATIQFGQLTPEMEEEEKKEYFKAKEIYEKYFNVGQKFKPIGENANKNVECKITFIHAEKELVTWKQTNLSTHFIENSYKPACGKFSINAMLQLVKNKEIEFIN